MVIKTTKECLDKEILESTADLSKIFDGLWEADTLNEQDGDQRLATPLKVYFKVRVPDE